MDKQIDRNRNIYSNDSAFVTDSDYK